MRGLKKTSVRHFQVGLGWLDRQMRVEAADEETRTWAMKNLPVMRVALDRLARDVHTRPVAREPKLGYAVSANAETPRTLAARWEAIIKRAFPEETFVVDVLSDDRSWNGQPGNDGGDAA